MIKQRLYKVPKPARQLLQLEIAPEPRHEDAKMLEKLSAAVPRHAQQCQGPGGPRWRFWRDCHSCQRIQQLKIYHCEPLLTSIDCPSLTINLNW